LHDLVPVNLVGENLHVQPHLVVLLELLAQVHLQPKPIFFIITLTYWQNAWNDVQCSDKCGKGCYVNYCMRAANDTQFISVFWLVQMLLCVMLFKDKTSFQMLRQTGCQLPCTNWRFFKQTLLNTTYNSFCLSDKLFLIQHLFLICYFLWDKNMYIYYTKKYLSLFNIYFSDITC